MKHKVSIVMPVLNGERYIGEALQSIAAQTYKDYELILVNDGSTDKTVRVAEAFMDRMDIKVVQHPARKGIAASVNDGLRAATGEYITFLDHDDLWLSDMLATQIKHLEQNPDVGMVHADFQTIDPDGRIIEESVAKCRDRRRPSGHVFRDLFLDSFICANSVLIRKECFDRLGGYDEGLLWGDYHMWLRIARHYKIDYIPKVLAQYRQHFTQGTRSVPVLRADEDPIALSAVKSIVALYPEVRKELGERTIRRRMAAVYFGGAYYWFEYGAFANARIHLAKAISLWPSNLRYYLMYMATLLKPGQAEALRRAWHRVQAAFSPRKKRTEQWQVGEWKSTGL